jgi:hypothetical protein
MTFLTIRPWTRLFNCDPISQLDTGARLPSHACRPGRLLNLFLSFFDSGAVPRRNAVWRRVAQKKNRAAPPICSGSFRAMPPGNCDNPGKFGNVKSVTYRLDYSGDGSNPSLSACRFNNLQRVVTKKVTKKAGCLKC